MMLRRRTAIFALVILVVLGGIASYVQLRSSREFYSDPAQLRAELDWNRAHSIGTNPPAPATPPRLELISTSSNEVVFRIIGRREFGKESMATELLEASGTNAIKIGEGSISLVCIGVGYTVPKTNANSTIRIPAELYTPDLRLLSSNETKNLPAFSEWNDEMTFRGAFPSGKLVFALSNLTNVKIMGTEVFDARTRKSVLPGASSSSTAAAVYAYRSDFCLWHQTPVQIVLTVACGQTESFRMPAREGAQLSYPGGVLTLVKILDGSWNGISSSDDGMTNIAKVQRSSRGEPGCSLVFGTKQSASREPIAIEISDDAGRIVSGRGASETEGVLLKEVSAAADRIKDVSVLYYTHVYRLVFEIPELPGLPEENRGLKNLFDTRIPYLRLDNSWEVLSTLEKLTEMSSPTPIFLNPTNVYFPLIYTNVATRDVFRDISKHLVDPRDQLSADPKKNEIRIVRPPILVLLEKIQRFFK